MRKFIILVLSMGLFFSAPFGKIAQAIEPFVNDRASFMDFDPMEKALEAAEKAKEELLQKEAEEARIEQEQEKSKLEKEEREKAQAEAAAKFETEQRKKIEEKQKIEEAKKAEEAEKSKAQEKEREQENQKQSGSTKGTEAFSYRLKLENGKAIVEINPEVIDPMSKIEKIVLEEKKIAEKSISGSEIASQATSEEKENEDAYLGMVAGFPMEAMVPAMAKGDRSVSSFLIAIAKKESDWGKHVPLKDGRDCYNYWGYRGTYNQTDSGYSCFDSPEQAVEVVGGRIQRLLDQEIDTPEKMIVWKCGSDCNAAGGQAAADKWISDVDHYYKKLNT